ncbi:hypothetical protein AOLI_G00215790 [Acnodon oligacanthus]
MRREDEDKQPTVEEKRGNLISAPRSAVRLGCLRFRSSRSAESARGLVTATDSIRSQLETDTGSVLFSSVLFLLKRR